MKIINTIYKCDICKNETKNDKEINISVVFNNEQTEGRWCKPYLSNEKINICDDCLNEIYSGKQLLGSGAQGCNKYYFKEENNE